MSTEDANNAEGELSKSSSSDPAETKPSKAEASDGAPGKATAESAPKEDASGDTDPSPEANSDGKSEDIAKAEADSANASANGTESTNDTDGQSQSAAEDGKSDAKDATKTDTADQGAKKGFPLKSLGAFVLGTLLLFLLQAHSGQVAHGAAFGFVFAVVACIGLMGALGMFRGQTDAAPFSESTFWQLPGEASWASPRSTVPFALLILGVAAIFVGYDAMPFAIIAALFALVPSALKRPGLAVFVIVSGIYLPLLGTFDLWDPWETHYGEVAREIVSRDDWISLWWAQDGWFWSKPIAIFWSEAFWLSALNVDVAPDANPAAPEWAIRLPLAMFSIAAVLTVYGTMKRIFGTRPAVLSALVLATTPHFFLLAHQAITDMYLVSNVVMATCMLMLAFVEDPNAEGRTLQLKVGGRTVGIHLAHLVVGGLILLALPQALYLISRNIELIADQGFRWHGDEFLYGSAGNDGVPGNAALGDRTPAFDALWAQPITQGLIWLLGLAGLLAMLRKERRLQALYMTAFYVFCAIAFMGKGIPGLALPGVVALFYLVASRRWQTLFSGQLRVAPGILIVTVVGLPWYVAMFMRHGTAFTDRLLIHDHINRVAAGVHGDTGSIQYFLWQLGYATFPWVALVPAALMGWLWMRRRTTATGTGGFAPIDGVDSDHLAAWHRKETMTLLALWFFAAFTLFSAMITKFHHYIFPAVPPASMMVGLLLHQLWGKVRAETKQTQFATLGALIAPVFLVLGFGGLWGDLRGVIPENAEGQDWVMHNGMGAAAYVLIFVGAAILAAAGRFLWQHRREEDSSANSLVATGSAVGAGAVLLAFVGRDLSWVTAGRPQGYERLIHLFVYKYDRPWPEHFDYRPILTGFAIAATLLVVLAALRMSRMVAARALLGLALLFSAWTLNVYMIDLAPHWGMGTLFRTYYDQRQGPEEPVLAWQMNWKGENFYTGNRAHVFVDLDNAKIREWLGEHADTTFYAMLEHSRLNSFRSVIRGRNLEEVTTKRDCNKFILVRVTPQ